MAPLTNAASRAALLATSTTRSSLRLATSTSARTTAAAVAGLSTSSALRDASSSSTYESPFKGETKSTKIPDFSKYMSKGSGGGNQLFGYFMVGTLGAISAAGAKSTIQGELG